MGVTERWARKLLARMRQEGGRAAIHRLRGRRSNRWMEGFGLQQSKPIWAILHDEQGGPPGNSTGVLR